MRSHTWRNVVLDEAQAIKNPGAKQTKAIKTLDSRWRLALTGTPVENRLGDLWSIFDFLNPGLLGSAKAFNRFCKSMELGTHGGYAPLRRLVQPYVLRRLKTDKSVIADLPDKTEVTAHCLLSKRQAALYTQSVEAMKTTIEAVDGIERRGVVLAFLTRFKQICNQPVPVARRRELRGRRQRQAHAARRVHRLAPGQSAGVHAVPRDDGAAISLSDRTHCTPVRTVAAFTPRFSHAPSIAANAACDWPSAIRHSRSVRVSTTSHHAIGAGRCEARGCRWAYFSQPICGDDRSLCSPEPSPPVPRQRAQSANSLGKWHARQDSNLRPSA